MEDKTPDTKQTEAARWKAIAEECRQAQDRRDRKDAAEIKIGEIRKMLKREQAELDADPAIQFGYYIWDDSMPVRLTYRNHKDGSRSFALADRADVPCKDTGYLKPEPRWLPKVKHEGWSDEISREAFYDKVYEMIKKPIMDIPIL